MDRQFVYLLVDDDEDDQELFKIALEEIDSTISCASAMNGQEALTMLENREVSPDYIFLDLNMPLMGGKDFLRNVKTDKDLKEIPVVIFSTSSDPSDKKETERLGAIGFITKPAKISELTHILNTFIAHHHHQSAD